MSLIGRLGVLTMVFALLAAPLPASAQEADQGIAAFAGAWGRHGFGITVNDDGSAEATWRVYRWCGPGVQRPCDQLTEDRIIAGGYAEITFSGVDENGVLQGEVNSASDAELLADGSISLSPQPYGMLLLEQGTTQLALCGAHYIELAPPEVLDEYPCGA